MAGGISAPLLTLYDRIRTQTGSTGAAMLKARQCQGCRIELYGNELSAVRNADPHEVVRCENCGRILVRTAESGPVMPMRRLIVEADGGSRGNPGPAGYGALVRDAETGRVLAERAASVGRATNNVAEYGGLVAGLQAALDLDPSAEVEVRMDSKLVVEQMSGRWQIKHPDMQQLALQAQKIARQLGGVRYTWVPRAQNGAADALANSAMDGKPVHRDAGRRGRRGSRTTCSRRAEPAPVVTTVTHLLRHGQTEHTPERRYSGRNELPLSRTGRAEAEAAAARAADLGIEVVVASPLRRTRETAEIVAAALGLPVEFDEDLVELDFGDLEGLTFDEARAEAPAGGPPVHGRHHRGRAGRGVGRRRQRRGWPGRGGGSCPRYAGRTVLVVSHVTPIKLLLAAGLGVGRRGRAPGVPGGGVAVHGRVVVGRPDVGALVNDTAPPALTEGRHGATVGATVTGCGDGQMVAATRVATRTARNSALDRRPRPRSRR